MSPFHQFPEELLERILSHVIDAAKTDDRPAWLRSPSYRPDFRLAPLLVSKCWARIALPLFYRSVRLDHPITASLLRRALEENPDLSKQVQHLSVTGVSDDAARVMRLCEASIKVLDITLDDRYEEDGSAKSAEEIEKCWTEALKVLTSVQHLALRKPNNVYLSLARPRFMITAVAQAITSWPGLKTADIAFKLSDDTPTSPQLSSSPTFSTFQMSSLPFPALSPSSPSSPIEAPSTSAFPFPPPASLLSPTKQGQPLGPISSLTHALATAPQLHTFSTHLPAVWNVSILTISSNPQLERIVLSSPGSRASASIHSRVETPARPGPGTMQGSIFPTGLFLMEARRHPRLSELIKAGTAIIRTRAVTLETPTIATPTPRRKEKDGRWVSVGSPTVMTPTNAGSRFRGLGQGQGLGFRGVEEANKG